MADVQVVHASYKGRWEDNSFLFSGMHIALDTNWLASVNMPVSVTRAYRNFAKCGRKSEVNSSMRNKNLLSIKASVISSSQC